MDPQHSFLLDFKLNEKQTKFSTHGGHPEGMLSVPSVALVPCTFLVVSCEAQVKNERS